MFCLSSRGRSRKVVRGFDVGSCALESCCDTISKTWWSLESEEDYQVRVRDDLRHWCCCYSCCGTWKTQWKIEVGGCLNSKFGTTKSKRASQPRLVTLSSRSYTIGLRTINRRCISDCMMPNKREEWSPPQFTLPNTSQFYRKMESRITSPNATFEENMRANFQQHKTAAIGMVVGTTVCTWFLFLCSEIWSRWYKRRENRRRSVDGEVELNFMSGAIEIWC